jgi:hypothetical protein
MKILDGQKFNLMEFHPCRNYSIGRNASYLKSVWNGFKAGIWWLPQSVLLIIRMILWPTLQSLLWAAGLVLLVIIRHVLLLICGLTGYLRDDRDDAASGSKS